MIHPLQIREYFYTPYPKSGPIILCPRDTCRQELAVGGHVDGGMALESVFAPPKSSGGLQIKGIFCQFILGQPAGDPHLILSIEVDTTSSVERNVSKCASLVPAPREHGQGHGNGNVNSDLSHVNLPLEFPSGSTGLSENGGSVAILVLVDDLESLIESLGVEDDENRSEDLFVVAFHRGVGLDDGRSNEVSVWISFYLGVASVQEDLSALRLSGADKSEDTVFGSGRDDRTPVHACMSNASAEEGKDAQVSVGLKTSVDAELRGTLDETRKELLGVSNENGN
jgi:hypothetical protein